MFKSRIIAIGIGSFLVFSFNNSIVGKVFAEEDWMKELKRELSQMKEELKRDQEELKRELEQSQKEIETEVNSSGKTNYKCGVNIDGDVKNTKVENEVIINGKKVKDCKLNGKDTNIGGVVIKGGKVENSVIKNKTTIKNSEIIINGKRIK